MTLGEAAIKKILNLNEVVETSETDDASSSGFLAPTAPILKDGLPIWKVLVFDVRTPAFYTTGHSLDFLSCVECLLGICGAARRLLTLVPYRTLVAM